MQENNIEKEELKEEMDNSEQEITEETNCDDNITDINEKLEEKKLQDEVDKVNDKI